MPRPSDTLPCRATHYDVTFALMAAGRLTGVTPADVLRYHRREHERTRHHAFAALVELFPDHPKSDLARMLGYSSPASAASNLNYHYVHMKWWRDVWIDEIVGALVKDQYGDRAL